MQSGRSESGGPVTQRSQSLVAGDTRGKHRIQAELKRLEQEARFLEEELELLEKTAKASAACNEILNNVEMKPDPLLPVTYGPLNPIWDRWFEGPQDPQGCSCRCWILWRFAHYKPKLPLSYTVIHTKASDYMSQLKVDIVIDNFFMICFIVQKTTFF